MAGYDDGRVTLTDRGIVLRRYYLRRDKQIAYADIREARQVPVADVGRRVHGSSDGVHWFNHDPERLRKDAALVLYLDPAAGKTALAEKLLMADEIRPVITPDDPGRVAAELAAHGVPVTSGDEPKFRWWSSLSPRGRWLIGLAAAAEVGLMAATQTDIGRRPASQIRGPKGLWRALAFLNFAGPLAYFTLGRRRPG
jgi:hypothetical protein